MKQLTRISLSMALLASISGCDWIGRQADALGSHMPVIGERCEHWQCITESGRQKSEMYKAQQSGATQQEAAPVEDVEHQQAPQPQQPLTPYDQYHQ